MARTGPRNARPPSRAGRADARLGTGARERSDSRDGSAIRCSARLLQPKADAGSGAVAWTFLRLPAEASALLSSRGMVSVRGTFHGVRFAATLRPDGEGGHWLRVENELRAAAGVAPNDLIELEFAQTPPDEEPEPEAPAELRTALAAASPKAREVWSDITPAARRDFIHWITSAKRPETRAKRVENACDMLAKGRRRPCCFDRSGMFDKSLRCPPAAGM